MKEKDSAGKPAIGRMVAAQIDQVCKDCGSSERPDLVVEEGETATIAYESARFRPLFRQMKPQSVDEVRRLMGVTAAVAEQAGKARDCGCGKGGQFLGGVELESEDAPTRGKALSLARNAARAYVMGGAKISRSEKAVLDRYVAITGALVNIAFLQDIVVHNGATLNVAASTHALYAAKIRIHGTGRIRCLGPTTINCTSLEGDYKRFSVVTAVNPNVTFALKS